MKRRIRERCRLIRELSIAKIRFCAALQGETICGSLFASKRRASCRRRCGVCAFESPSPPSSRVYRSAAGRSLRTHAVRTRPRVVRRCRRSAHVGHFRNGHARVENEALPIAVERSEEDKRIVVREQVNLIKRRLFVQNMLHDIEEKNLVELVMPGRIRSKSSKLRDKELHLLGQNAQVIAHFFAIAVLRFMNRSSHADRTVPPALESETGIAAAAIEHGALDKEAHSRNSLDHSRFIRHDSRRPKPFAPRARSAKGLVDSMSDRNLRR